MVAATRVLSRSPAGCCYCLDGSTAVERRKASVTISRLLRLPSWNGLLPFLRKFLWASGVLQLHISALSQRGMHIWHVWIGSANLLFYIRFLKQHMPYSWLRVKHARRASLDQASIGESRRRTSTDKVKKLNNAVSTTWKWPAGGSGSKKGGVQAAVASSDRDGKRQLHTCRGTCCVVHMHRL